MNISTSKCAIEKLKKFVKNDKFQTTVVIIMGWFIVFIPIYISLFFWWLLNPIGFAQGLIFTICAFAGLGWIQVILIFLGISFTLFMTDNTL